jgi:hypothetical protein
MKSLLFTIAFFCLSLSLVPFTSGQIAVVTLNSNYFVIDSQAYYELEDNTIITHPEITPNRFNGSPTGTLDNDTTSTALSLNTDVKAECRYQPTWPGITFETMTPFDHTNTVFHRQLITIQQNSEKYSYSVRCKNITTGSTNINNYNIVFSVGIINEDNTEVGPIRSNGQPTGILLAGTTSTTMSVNTDVTAECRYKAFTLDLSFESMTPMTTTNSILHQQLITGLADGEHYQYSIRCRDNTTGTTNTKNYNIPFSIDEL